MDSKKIVVSKRVDPKFYSPDHELVSDNTSNVVWINKIILMLYLLYTSFIYQISFEYIYFVCVFI